MLIPEAQLREINIATISMGQGIAVTPIQMIAGISAIANGGNYMQPYLVKEIRDREGNVIEKIEPKKVRQVISEDVSKELCLLLENVVKQGPVPGLILKDTGLPERREQPKRQDRGIHARKVCCFFCRVCPR